MNTPELDYCIAEAERHLNSTTPRSRTLRESLQKQAATEGDERYLEHKAPTKPEIPTESYDALRLGGQLLPGFYADFGVEPPEPPPREWMHGLKEANERLSELREILWADVRFWKRVAAGYSAEQLSRYIRDHYRLGFPAWPAVVWQQMVHQPQKREKLLSLHRYEIDFDEQRDEDALRDMRSKLEALNAIRNDIDARYGFRNGAPRINLGPCGRFARDFRETWNKRFRNPVCSLDLAFKGEL